MQNFEATPALNPNQLISNRYRLQQFLGRGAFGQVFAAEDIKFVPPKRVAIKLINPEFMGDPVVREDVRREAGVMARFNHPNILRVLDYEVAPNLGYIVTDLAEGGSLSTKIQPDPTKPPVQMPMPEVLQLMEQIGSALDEAHKQGLVHRDIKPQNILLDKWGRPLLADFGLATALNGSQKSVMVMATTSGTPPYMAPEQWTGQAGKASDIYALGVLAYQLISGRTPFQGNQFELMGQHMNTPVPPLSANAPGLKYSPELDRVIAQAMEKNPQNRIKSALEFAQRLKAAAQGGVAPVQAQPQPQAQPAMPVTEVYVPPVAPINPVDNKPAADPLRAETQVVSIPPNLQNQVQQAANPAQPVYNQNAYAPNQGQNYTQNAYNPNQNYNQQPYNPNVNQYNPNQNYYPPAPPARRNNNNLYLIGGAVALVVVLIVVVIAVAAGGSKPTTNNNGNVNNPAINNGNNNGGNNNGGNNNNSGGQAISSRTSLRLYPNVNQINVDSSFVQQRMAAYEQAFGKQAHEAKYYLSPDSIDQIGNFFSNDAQNKGLMLGPSQKNGVTEYDFTDFSTGDIVVIVLYPPQVTQANGLNFGSNNLIEIID